MGRQWDKFRLLIWKNWLLQRRHKLQTAVEILAPVIFATFMVLVRSLVEPEMADEVNFESFAATKFLTPSLIGNTTAPPSAPNNILSFNFTISFSPDTKRSKALITRSMRHLLVENVGPYGYLININRYIVGYPNSSAMMTSLTDPLANETNLCGIEFDDEIIGKDFWPDNVKMTLHFPAELRTQGIQAHFFNWKTNFLYPMFQTPGPRAPKDKAGGWPGYVQEGFMPLAHAIYRELTMEISKNANPGSFFSPRAMSFPKVEIQRFPHPVFLSDDLLTALQGFISIIIMLSFNYTCINTVKVIATEKERQLKEVMKIMGLDNWLHWTAWFIKAFSYIMITVIFIVILLKVEWYDTKSSTLPGYSVFTFTPWHFILFFLMIYMATSICFCFMISVFFSRANTAATVAGLMWFLSYAPYMFLSNDQVLPSVATRLSACLASNTAMAFGFEIILANEATAEGLLWSKIWTPTTIDDTLVMGHIIIMLVVDAVLYLLIALYVEQVFPGSYGVPQPWYFPVSGEYWRSSFRCMSVVEDIPHDNEELSNEAIEADPKGLNVGINIKNLTKIYNKKVAVDKLNFKIFEDQITVLLGHNGAGKTTTMSMLTGMFPPTSGTATVNGHDIRHDVAGVRDSLGICPQHNVLFADLTVAEHIYFYARLKGVSGSALKEEVNKYVSLLDLENKRDVISNSLSGGMQRRLSVGAALCGGSKVVLLDEPSSGMDPSARRHLWDLLHAEKKGRTVILSTHFMDEAEVLGERVAVLAGGRLRAVGSPFHLKKKFGSGYRLTAATRGLPSAPVTALIRNHIPQATLYSDIGSELCYLLPDDLSGVFEPMLKELELRQDELGLTSFGISATTLEDVFMKVGADAVEIVDDQDQITYKENDSNGVILIDETQKNGHALNENDKCSDIRYTGFRLYVDQWKAMLYKKMVVTLRSWLLSILQLVIPVLFLIIAIMVSRMWQTSIDLPGLDMTISESYTDTVTLVNAPTDADAVTLTRQKIYKQFFADAKIDTLKVVDTGSKTIDEFYLKQAEYDMPQMRVRNLAGATFSNSSNVKVWFSNFAYHDLPVSMMLTHNAILKAESPNSSFTLINKPLPFTLKNQFEMLNYGDNSGFQIAFNIGFSMAFVSAFYVLFYIKENVCRSKLLQLASGASPVILWGSAFLWDLLCFLIISLALCITLAISNESGFATAPEIGRVLLILMVFGWGMLPIHFVASHSFRTPSTGFSRMCLFNIFTGVATFLVVEVLNAPGLDLEHVANILHWIFLLVPNYALCGALKNLYEASITLKGCQAVCDVQNLGPTCDQYFVCQMSPAFERCCISDHPYFDWTKPGVGAHVLYMMVVGIVMFLFLLIKEYRISNELLHCWKKPPPLGGAGEVEDSDVAEEREKVASLPKEEYQNYSLLCKDMSKYYLNFLAVNQISLAVKNGECFGLLGINGAGKTTTFKMLTGDLDISSGGAWVTGHSVAKDMKTVYNSIGYCPQFDALLDEMTGRETLHMFAQLRGIPKLQQQRYVWDLSKRLGFVKHLDKKVREYSGGNKRKLSTSLALLGDPQVVYLDEPTTGMDPMAKRQVWRAVAGRKTGSVVLTSHSMEECEALCTRLAIMVNGRFRCLGSTQHLKNKFSQGYTLIVKLRRLPIAIHAPVSEGAPDLVPTAPPFFPGGAGYQFNTESLHRFLLERFPGAQLKESYQGLITYYLPDTNIMWSTIFGVMEAAKTELDIEDYSIGQTSLEQIFLQFTKDQRAHQDD